MHPKFPILLLISSLFWPIWAHGEEKPQADAKSDPPGVSEYLGRKVAQTMHYAGAPWLIRKMREEEERASLLLQELGVEKGMTVADVGCGNGFHTIPIAEKVGPSGKVYAADIQEEMLVFLKKRAGPNLKNIIVPIHNKLWDAMLPKGEIDLVLLVDVYHEFSHPAEMLASIHAALKPDGQVALVEYRGEDPKVPIKPLHKMTKEQCLKEFRANGFELSRSFDDLPWQHLLFFRKVAASEETSVNEIQLPE